MTHAAAGWRDYVALVRPAQWVKNIVVFAGPAAGLKLFQVPSFYKAAAAFGAFCLAASAIYALNDTVDRDADASHPTKRDRPVARGAIQPFQALMLSGTLAACAILASATLINRATTYILLLYLGGMVAYAFVLKRRVILDVITLASGFVLRAWGGASAVEVPTSEWLVACVFTLCLFMGFGKRRCEVVSMANSGEAERHRETLIRYTPDLLTHLITVSAGIAVTTFLLYTLDTTRSPSPFHKEYLFYTLPIVVYGVFRYAMLTELGIYSGPTEIVLKDRMMLACIVLWTIVALAIAYYEPISAGLSIVD